jgi:hypothetical protein
VACRADTQEKFIQGKMNSTPDVAFVFRWCLFSDIIGFWAVPQRCFLFDLYGQPFTSKRRISNDMEEDQS